MQICRPQTLHAAIVLAKKYEQEEEAQRRSRYSSLDRRSAIPSDNDSKASEQPVVK